MRRLACHLFALVAAAVPPAAYGSIVATDLAPTVARTTLAVADSESSRYGPFQVLDARRVALIDVTDEDSPAQFAALLLEHPEIEVIEMVECPGTDHDIANMELGRMIRARGIATYVPRGGSVRSGAVELFLAGGQRQIAEGAEFAVHAWMDADGRQASDFPAGAREHRFYLDYYEEMGFSPAQARAFYAMTNSVGFEDALWLTGAEMRRWLQPERGAAMAKAEMAGANAGQRLGYLDLGAPLP
ncbi:alpha/beta hydrolase [Altererythrobacter sp. SALINAS58]|uniref:alpha/beta hydrolase n=1 Tax=Alteripontixanthobacter muriae TaxID=2705546 RepID=UPI001576F8C4|nr:alpha/beta hydrolase [Alteripontixanthobacter muriae]NTZ43129.1 alpha/beta hydrolase [Alteripontixanthobacter muriae]